MVHETKRALLCTALSILVGFSPVSAFATQTTDPAGGGSPAPPADATADPDDAQSAPSTMLRLKSGEILWGSIAAHDPDGIHFRRLDNRGEVGLPWSFLDPQEEQQLRLRFGYVEMESDELLADADRILLTDGTEVVGRIVNRTDEHLWFKRAEGTIPVDKRRIQGAPTRVRVPALEIHSKEELYQLKAFELQDRLLLEGREGALAHDELAQYAERLFDYPHAAEHYKHAAKLDPTHDTERLNVAVARSGRKAELQDQVDLLAQVDLMRARGRYDRAFALLDTFPELFPDSPLLEDHHRMRVRVERFQERELREEVVHRVNAESVRVARDTVRGQKTFEEVLGFVDEAMADEVFARVVEGLATLAPDIPVEEVRRLWEERTGGRFRQASYGIGTWILGVDRATLRYDKEKDAKEEPRVAAGSQREARKRLEEKIQRYLQNQELARKAKAQTAEEEDPDVFWARWNHQGRYQWVLAYFAEHSGVYRVEMARFTNCRECGGTGAREVISTGSAIAGDRARNALVACTTCHTIGIVRRVRYR